MKKTASDVETPHVARRENAADSVPTVRSLHQDEIAAVLQQYWGYDTLRPHQREAIAAGIARRDSLVVLPTGGGKSICYQIPPLVAKRTDIVVSPLISLMKDQVDALREIGYPAVALHSGLDSAARSEAEQAIVAGGQRLIFVAPERLFQPSFLGLLGRIEIGAFAIDEAHCISQWGHDFRPEYRQLASLRRRFPAVSMHAYTATATPRVREDIVAQLHLQEPAIHIGTFDRPNLTYRVVQRVDLEEQVLAAVRRHAHQAVIIYCISRRDTENLAGWLAASGIRAGHYHAGMEAADRQRVQDAFQKEKLDVVVATVAFGMGIDRGDVRCVIHAAMPKSVEHYQQETGRAGRDGLPAECILFYSAADTMRWQDLIAKSTGEQRTPPEVCTAQEQLLAQMRAYCTCPECRHDFLSGYFGQKYPHENCGACDTCLGESPDTEDATVLAQKILSGVARVEQRFGVRHVMDMLRGKSTKLIRDCRHDKLSTFGLLRGMDESDLRNVIFQMIDRALLDRTPGDRPLLKLTRAGLDVMRGEKKIRLAMPQAIRASAVANIEPVDVWEDVDRGLFDALRTFRREIAEERNVPPFVIFADTTLQDLARFRPAEVEELQHIRGIGEKKRADLGDRFVDEIVRYCSENGVTCPNEEAMQRPQRRAPSPVRKKKKKAFSAARAKAIELFAEGRSIAEVAQQIDRAISTTAQYLGEYIETHPSTSIAPWVAPEVEARVADAAREMETAYLGPIRARLNDEVSFEEIRLVVAKLRGQVGSSE
ncbi:MAG: DNA helicase RecQ [Phycisphaerae bacterium]